MDAPTTTDVDAISGLDDPEVRNLQITQCYFRLSRAVTQMGPASPNWCTFATWASKQAGQSIRREDLVRSFERLFRNSPAIFPLVDIIARRVPDRLLPEDLDSRVDRLLRIIDPEQLFARVSEAVARGNKKVFEEIGREFARYLAEFQDQTAVDPERATAFNARLRPGEPPGGQQRLREAFMAYLEARFSPDPKARAEWMLLANLLVGFHEQIRLQPEIKEALDAAFADADAAKARIIRALLPGFWARTRHHVARLIGRPLPLDSAIDRLTEEIKRLAREVTTRSMMTLEIPPAQTLHLGRDLSAVFPDSLRTIANPQLRQLLDQVDPTPDSVLDSGAVDWADFDQRIHFIADFFRAYHEHTALFDSPFTSDQSAAIIRGERPRGRL